MLSKYEQAILEYEQARLGIENLSRKIGETSLTITEENTTKNCTDIQYNKECIERYWEVNIHNTSARELQECGIELRERVKLCRSCTELDRLIQERKKARQVFGRTKAKLSLLGKKLIKKGLG